MRFVEPALGYPGSAIAARALSVYHPVPCQGTEVKQLQDPWGIAALTPGLGSDRLSGEKNFSPMANRRTIDIGIQHSNSRRTAMNGKADGLRSLAMRSKIPAERIKYVSDADAGIIRSMKRGILFLMAFWSGSSISVFKKLTEVLAKLRTDELEFIVVDVDGSPDLYEVPEFKGQIRGCGEIAWILDGRIVSFSGAERLNVDCIETNTLALLWGQNGAPAEFEGVPSTIEWLDPWKPLSTTGTGFVRELERELSDKHIMFGIPVVTIAKRIDCDDVLFATIDRDRPLAVVHLTWAGLPDADIRFPESIFYASWNDWIEQRMRPDHKTYSASR